MKTYYYLTAGDSDTNIGGPYTTLAKAAAGVRKARRRGVTGMRVRAIQSGRWRPLSPDETEALLAILEGL